MQQSQHSLRKTSSTCSCFCNGLARESKGMKEQCTHHTTHSEQHPSYFSTSNLLHHFLQQYELLLTIFWCTQPSIPGKRPQTGTWMHVSQHAAVFSKLKPWWWVIPVLLHSSNGVNTKVGFKERVCLILADLYTDTVKRVCEEIDGISTIHILPLPSSG